MYTGWFGPLSRAVQAGSVVGSIVQRVPLVQPTMKFWGERAVSLVGAPERGTTPDVRSWIAAEASDASGNVLATVNLAGADGYDFTASFVAWAAQRHVEGAGVLGPVTAFGLAGAAGRCAQRRPGSRR